MQIEKEIYSKMNKEKSWNWKQLYDSNHNTAANAQAKIELSISARNLINLDLVSKSDPQCIVYMRTSTREEYEEIGRTEVLNDDLNPDFSTKILLTYNFEVVQYLKFELWHIDLNDNDFLGRVETTLPEIIANKNRQFIRQITGIENKNCGDLIIVVEELSSCKQNLIIKLRSTLCKSHFFKPNAFFKIWRSNEDSSFTIVHKSSVIRSSKKPSWPELNLKVKNLCNGDYDRNIKIEFFNHKKSALINHREIGCVYTSLNQLLNLEKEGNSYEIRNEKKKKTKGTLLIEYTRLANTYSFFDYVRGNLDLYFSVAIDFTSSNSNGPPNSPTSFHFIDPSGSKSNLYQVAIRSIGRIIEYYNSSHRMQGWGFGAELKSTGKISHCFPLNDDPDSPYCESVDDLLNHYKKTIENVKLSGPTNFAVVIDCAANMAKNMEPNSYSILLIITDGVLCDLPQTKRSIIRASQLPMSIIIVGIGNANFGAMVELDSDDGLLEQDGKRAVRDIVQFVELRKYINTELNVVDSDSENELAKETLYEVPEQVVNYFEMLGIKPQF